MQPLSENLRLIHKSAEIFRNELYMKRILILLIALGISLHLNAQKTLSSQDSIKTFYNELFSALKKSYLHRKNINWKEVEPQLKERLQGYDNFQKSLSEIKPLFDKIGATHCQVYVNKVKYAGTGKKITKDDYSEQLKKKHESKPNFEVKVLNGKYGYVLIPGMVFFDTSPVYIHNLAQPLYDQIADIKTKNKLEGWIVDLRLNTGGNSTPMLLALYDLLGDNEIWGSLDINKKQINKYYLSKGRYMEGNKNPAYINPKGALLDREKVAVITGVFTGSSGEVTALAFKGRPNTIFIGESTFGATTGNMFWPLPFDNVMALTNSYDSDRNGNYYEQIIPDVRVSKQDNFDDLLLDENIREAIRYISTSK